MTLDAKLKEIRDRASASGTKLYDDLVAHLKESGALNGLMKVGAAFPDFALPNAEGRIVTRADVLTGGPAVIVFDRGAWCPYCTAVLGELAKIGPALKAAGAAVVAVTPEVSGGAARIKSQCGIDFDVLSDIDNLLGMECGLVFRLPDSLRRAYLEKGIDLERLNGNDLWLLPAPATFVIASDGTVAKSFLDIDFRYRVEPAEILKTVQALR
jgi:peroxiredoxin